MNSFNGICRNYVPPSFRLETPSANDLEYRVMLSELNGKDADLYYDIINDEFEFSTKMNYRNMKEKDEREFISMWLGTDKKREYFYIVNENKPIGEIFITNNNLKRKEKYNYRLIIFIEEKYRNLGYGTKALKELSLSFYSDTDSFTVDVPKKQQKAFNLFEKAKYKLNTEFESGTRRYIYNRRMFKERNLIKPQNEYEKAYKEFTGLDNYKYWLKKVNKNKIIDTYFFMEKESIVGIVQVKKFKYHFNFVYPFKGDIKYTLKNKFPKERDEYIIDMMNLLYEIDKEYNEDEREFMTICIDSSKNIDIRTFDKISDYNMKIFLKDVWFNIQLIVE